MMSHEVNNTVGATRSLLQSSLAYGAGLPAERRAELEGALGTAGERLDAFMRGFAGVVRMPPPVKRPADVGQLLEGCVRLVQARADPARVRWEWEREGWPFLAELDAAQMEHVLINVLKNAVEALPPGGGTVTVRAVSAPGGAYVEIEDSGPGVSPEARPHLFTPFFTTKQSGHGIGLTMVQEILCRHGFAYGLDGPPGGPTRFRIDLGSSRA